MERDVPTDGADLSRPALRALSLAPSQSMGPRIGPALGLARLRGTRHDEQRLGGHTGTPRRFPGPGRGHEPCCRRSSPPPISRCRPISRTGSGTIPKRWPRRCGWLLDAGLAGCSIEDFTGRSDDPIYDVGLAAERIAAASDVAHSGPVRLVLTGRAENYLHGHPDLDDTIARLQAYQEAGADVLYAPGLTELDDIRHVVEAVDRPVNVLARPGGPTVAGARRRRRGPHLGGWRACASPPSAPWSRRPTSCRSRGPTGSSSGRLVGCKAPHAPHSLP